MAFSSEQVINMANHILENKDFKRRIPKVSFSEEETRELFNLIFFKPPTIELRIRQRAIQKRELNFRRKMFINHYLETMGNGAKSARLAGYSPRCAKQIAYKLLRS